MDGQAQIATLTRTIRMKVRPEAYRWLNAAAVEVNQVWNWANSTSIDAADRNRRANAKWLSGFDLDKLSAGAVQYFERINADTIQRVNAEYVTRRRSTKRVKLRWRVSRGARRALGWVPFKASSLKRKGRALRFCGKTFRVFDAERLNDLKWRQGCFAQDAVGDWFICLPVETRVEQTVAQNESVGIDLGLKDIATTSDGERLQAGRWSRVYAAELAAADRRGHRRHAKRIYRKISRCRRDALHKFSTHIVRQYQHIIVGDVSSTKLAKTKMAKSVLDSGWGMLRNMLDYKSQQAARTFSVVNERNTTRVCSSCGSASGPSGLSQLVVREWTCVNCGTTHDRDINAARNILALRCRASISGNELNPEEVAA